MTRWAYHEPTGSPCTQCGLTRSRHRVRHPPGCECGASHKGTRSPAERARGRPDRTYVVGIDGEGIGSAPHRYTLLAWSDEGGEHAAHIEDMGGLDSERCLRFLATSLPCDARPYGYYLGYDWTMILRDLPDRLLYRLYRPELRVHPRDEGGGFSPIRWRGWQLHWLAGMMRIRYRRGEWTTVWDVGRFWGTSFVRALQSDGVNSDGIEAVEIARMKARRATFSAREADEIRAYCQSECRQLAGLVRRLNAAHADAGLPLTVWYGPGSAASVALKGWGIREKRGTIPDDMRAPVATAFFGGRFENSRLGPIDGPIYSADIVSAYPAECTRLPCLEHATWEHTSREADLEHARHACVSWTTVPSRSGRAWMPLPVRLADGTIVYPRSGASGWAWRNEYLAARRWRQVRFRGAWILRSDCDCPPPFAGIADLFAARLAAGKKSAVGQALKRAVNSVYGKLAQSIGVPPYRSQVWAGMITSGCRARIIDILRRYDRAVLAVATDGVYMTRRPEVDSGIQLGQWEVAEHASIVLVRPGIYWTPDDTRSRGLPRALIDAERDTILAAIRRGASQCSLPPVRQFGSARASIYTTPDGMHIRRSPRYGEWYERPARVTFAPAPKRADDWTPRDLDGVESLAYGDETPDEAAYAAADVSAILLEDCL